MRPPALRCSLPVVALTFTLAVGACTPFPGAASRSDLLLDPDAPRYGRLLVHSEQRTLPIVRGDGIAELFVPVQIGTSRGWWQIDTGAALCAVNSRVARHEGFRAVTNGEIVTAAGKVDSQLGTLPSVRLAGLEIREVTVLSLDDRYVDEFRVQGRRGAVLGVLGADLLDFLDASIDLRANALRLRATPSSARR